MMSNYRHTRTKMSNYRHTRTNTHTHTRIITHNHVYIYIYTYIHTYLHTYIHTYVHITYNIYNVYIYIYILELQINLKPGRQYTKPSQYQTIKGSVCPMILKIGVCYWVVHLRLWLVSGVVYGFELPHVNLLSLRLSSSGNKTYLCCKTWNMNLQQTNDFQPKRFSSQVFWRFL